MWGLRVAEFRGPLLLTGFWSTIFSNFFGGPVPQRNYSDITVHTFFFLVASKGREQCSGLRVQGFRV